MKVLGFDPGVARLGYGVITGSGDRVASCQYGCIETPKTEAQADRLAFIKREISRMISEVKPDCIGVEKLFVQHNVRTALTVGEARGVILLCAGEARISLREINPLEVKQAVTGYGHADKSQIQRMLKLLLHLETLPKPDDAADALAVAYTAWLTIKSRL